jgi:hypothetical protein
MMLKTVFLTITEGRAGPPRTLVATLEHCSPHLTAPTISIVIAPTTRHGRSAAADGDASSARGGRRRRCDTEAEAVVEV